MENGARLYLAALGVLLLIAFSSRAQNRPGGGNGASGAGGCSTCLISSPATEQLTEAETQWLLLLREEEKLAGDVYTTLNNTWKLRLFSNIAQSEQRHFDAVGALLSRYGIADPATGQAGVFANPALQALYNELVARAQSSLSSALEVGVAVERQDIQDLQEAIAATRKTDILRVYSSLLYGSERHLEAFESHLEALGVKP